MASEVTRCSTLNPNVTQARQEALLEQQQQTRIMQEKQKKQVPTESKG